MPTWSLALLGFLSWQHWNLCCEYLFILVYSCKTCPWLNYRVCVCVCLYVCMLVMLNQCLLINWGGGGLLIVVRTDVEQKLRTDIFVFWKSSRQWTLFNMITVMGSTSNPKTVLVLETLGFWIFTCFRGGRIFLPIPFSLGKCGAEASNWNLFGFPRHTIHHTNTNWDSTSRIDQSQGSKTLTNMEFT